MYAKTIRFVLAYLLIPPAYLCAGSAAQPKLYLLAPEKGMVENICSVQNYVQISQNGDRRDFVQSRLYTAQSDGVKDEGRVIYRGELFRTGDFEKQRNKALDACHEFFKRARK